MMILIHAALFLTGLQSESQKRTNSGTAIKCKDCHNIKINIHVQTEIKAFCEKARC